MSNISVGDIANIISIIAGLMTILCISGIVPLSFFKEGRSELADTVLTVAGFSIKSFIFLIFLGFVSIFALFLYTLHGLFLDSNSTDTTVLIASIIGVILSSSIAIPVIIIGGWCIYQWSLIPLRKLVDKFISREKIQYDSSKICELDDFFVKKQSKWVKSPKTGKWGYFGTEAKGKFDVIDKILKISRVDITDGQIQVTLEKYRPDGIDTEAILKSGNAETYKILRITCEVKTDGSEHKLRFELRKLDGEKSVLVFNESASFNKKVWTPFKWSPRIPANEDYVIRIDDFVSQVPSEVQIQNLYIVEITPR